MLVVGSSLGSFAFNCRSWTFTYFGLKRKTKHFRFIQIRKSHQIMSQVDCTKTLTAKKIKLTYKGSLVAD